MSIQPASFLVVLTLWFLPYSALGQTTQWISLGSSTEDRLRTRQVMGQETTEGYLLRTASVLSTPLDSMQAPIDQGVRWRFDVLPVETHVVWNSDIPFSKNDGALWAGRGVNTLHRVGFRTTYKALQIIFAPELTHSQNRPFPISRVRTRIEVDSLHPGMWGEHQLIFRYVLETSV